MKVGFWTGSLAALVFVGFGALLGNLFGGGARTVHYHGRTITAFGETIIVAGCDTTTTTVRFQVPSQKPLTNFPPGLTQLVCANDVLHWTHPANATFTVNFESNQGSCASSPAPVSSSDYESNANDIGSKLL